MLYKVFDINGKAEWINSDYIIKIEKSERKSGYYIILVNRKLYRDSSKLETLFVRPGCDELRMLLDVDEE